MPSFIFGSFTFNAISDSEKQFENQDIATSPSTTCKSDATNCLMSQTRSHGTPRARKAIALLVNRVLSTIDKMSLLKWSVMVKTKPCLWTFNSRLIPASKNKNHEPKTMECEMQKNEKHPIDGEVHNKRHQGGPCLLGQRLNEPRSHQSTAGMVGISCPI